MTQRDDVFGDNLEPAPVAEPVDEPDETSQEPETTGKGMRQKLKEQASEIRALKEKYESDVGTLKVDAMGKAYEAIGLDENHGLRKAANMVYEGGPEGLAAFMEESFQYTYEGAPHPYAQAIAAGQKALDLIGQTAGSVAPPTQQDELSKAEANRDNATTLAIKGAQLERLIRR